MNFDHSHTKLSNAIRVKNSDADEIETFIRGAYGQTSNSHLIEIIFTSYGLAGAILAAFLIGKIYGNDSLTESLLNNLSSN